MKNMFILILICICSCLFITNVQAANNVEYKLTLTKKYDFNEVIKYSLTDYKQPLNGDNYFYYLIKEPVYTDIFSYTKYKKTIKKINNTYYMTLSHTYNEYTMSNANFLNNCFEKSKYDYDMYHITFEGRGGFKCKYADNIKIIIKTDFEVIDTNATIIGNEYVWYPKNYNFTMKIKLNKEYEEDSKYNNDATDEGMEEVIENEENANNNSNNDIEDNKDEQKDEDNTNENKKHKTNYTTTIIVAGVLIITVVAAAIILKQKSSDINKI